MKMISILLLTIMLTACTSKTKFGDCIGIVDTEDQTLVYATSGWNIFWGVVFSELVVPPIVVIASEFKCPVAKK